MNRKVVVIAGAGTSVDFGLPTGEGVLNELQTYERQRWEPFGDEDQEPTFDDRIENFDLFMNESGTQIHNHFPAFLRTVQGTSVPSIDLLAGQRPEFTALGKLWSVRCLFRNMREAEETCIQSRFGKPRSQNWLAGLCRLYYDGVTRMEDLRPNDLTIVTFNYDRLIEVGIASLLEHSFPGIGKAGLLPQVIHVHGAFDQLPHHVDARQVAEQAKRIRFVHETELIAMQQTDLQRAKYDIREADAVYCVGFALHASNSNLLDLPGQGSKIRTLNFDGRAGFNIAAAALGISASNIVSKMTVGAAVADDFFLR